MREDNRLNYSRRPASFGKIVESHQHRSLFDILFPICFSAMILFFVVAFIGMILSDGIWTDPATGCRYRVGVGETLSYSPLLLPSGLPDCRVVVKP